MGQRPLGAALTGDLDYTHRALRRCISELPPGLRERVRRVWGRHPAMVSDLTPTQKNVQRWSWSTAQNRGIGPQLAVWLTGIGLLFDLLSRGLFAKLSFGPPEWVAAAFLLVGAPFVTRAWKDPRLSGEDLLRVAPLLSPSPVERAYLDALGRGDEAETARLARLVETDARLARLGGELGESDPKLPARLAELEARARATADGATREAREVSVVLMRRRLESSVRAETLRERVRAHRELLTEQARSPAPGLDLPTLDLDALRDEARASLRDLAALEAAVQEMRAL